MSKKAKDKSAASSRTAAASTSAAAATPLPLSDFEGARAQWRAEVTEGLGGKANPRNRSGIEVKPLYTPRDWSGTDYGTRLAFPGEFPFTRGIYPSMYRGRSWSQRQLIGLGDDQGAHLQHQPTALGGGELATGAVQCGLRGGAKRRRSLHLSLVNMVPHILMRSILRQMRDLSSFLNEA